MSACVTRRLLITHHALLITKKLAGAEGFEPTNAGSKDRCLTTWRRPSKSAGILPAVVSNTAVSPLRIRRALPSYRERRANQFRVRSPEWRVVAHPRCQKLQKPQNRCPQVTPRSHLLLVMLPLLCESPGRGQTPRPRNHL